MTNDRIGKTRRHDRADGSNISRRNVLRYGAAASTAGIAAMAFTAGSSTAEQGATPSTETPRSGSSPYVEVEPGVRVFVQDWGEGKPIVLLHGWPSSHSIFEAQTIALVRRGYRVVGIDLRGFGESDKPWRGNDYDTWASDLGTVFAEMNLTDITLAGYSMGGAIAMHHVATSQDPRVSRLALIAAAGPKSVAGPDTPHGLPAEVFEGMLQGIATDRPGFFGAFMPSLFAQDVTDSYIRWFESVVLAASPYATLRGLEEARDRDLRPELDAIRIPTRIFHGMHDQVVPFPFAEEQRDRIAGAELVPFENSGHAIFHDEAGRLSDELAAFAG